MKILTTIFCMLLLTGCHASISFPDKEPPPLERQAILDDIITNEDFGALFEKAAFISDKKSDMNIIISDQLKEYLDHHSYTKEEMIKILKKNGFKIKQFQRTELKRKRTDKPYDTAIGGEKKLPSVSIRYVEFVVSIYYHQEAIVHVSGNVSSQGI